MSIFLRQIFNKINVTTNLNKNLIPKISSAGVWNRLYTNKPTPYEIVQPDQEKSLLQETCAKINDLIATNKQGRLFAIIHIAGKQFRITEDDVIIIEGFWPPDVGDKISLDKVMLVGAEEFSLIGCPLVQDGLVNVHATVIEKCLSHTKTQFKKRRRKQYMRIHFHRIQRTTLRINKIEIVGDINNPPDVSDTKSRII